MWARTLLRLSTGGTNRRYFLSQAYRCDPQWASRSEARTLRSVNPNDLYVELEQRFNKRGISSVDLDVFAHSATSNHLGELRDLLQKARSTAFTHLTLPSTSYATVRAFVGFDSVPELLDMLNDRLNYGLFLDNFTANMLFDKFLRDGDYESASKIAGFLMIQEDFEGPITEEFALYSVFKYLQLPIQKKVEEDKTEAVKTPVPRGKAKKVEEIKIRVAYLRNPFFDDHFDLEDNRAIAGKTMTMIASKRTDNASLNCNLLGLVFYKKYDKAKSVAQKIANAGSVNKETLERIQHVIENHDAKDEVGLKSLKDVFSVVENVPTTDESLEDTIKTRLLDAINKHEKDEIEQHLQCLSTWESAREAKLREQLEILETMRREEEIKKREKAIQEIDERLWFFDNEEKVEMKIEEKQKLKEETKPSKKQADNEYIPPEVSRRR